MSHNLVLINYGLSTVNIKLSIEEHHFNIAGVTPASRGGNEFTTLHPSDSVHVSMFMLNASLSHSYARARIQHTVHNMHTQC